MKSWLPFIVVLAILFVVGYVTSSWAAYALIVLCLIVYYIRLYYRKVVLPKRHLAQLKKEMPAEQSADARNTIH